jgi:endogenous inhibitor of DNA gyrase (YacG/DUF329 family)
MKNAKSLVRDMMSKNKDFLFNCPHCHKTMSINDGDYCPNCRKRIGVTLHL